MQTATIATNSTTAAKKRAGDIRVHGTSVSVWEDCPHGRPDEAGMRETCRAMLARLSARGWHVERDPKALEQYPSLADWRWGGKKGDLQVLAETSGRVSRVLVRLLAIW